MQSFFVLGLIPGTNIQINFLAWLIVALIVLGYLLNGYFSYLRYVKQYLKEIERPKPLPSNNFHTRLR